MTDQQLTRFFNKVNRTDSCWLWTAAHCTKGYGRFFLNGRLELSHRASYEHFVGPIPADREIDHLCRDPRCVNPAHLEAVTAGINQARGLNAERMRAFGRATRGTKRTFTTTHLENVRRALVAIHESNKGRTRREETKLKMGAARRAWWARKRAEQVA